MTAKSDFAAKGEILITGANGFLGNHLLRGFKNREVKTMDLKGADYNCDLSKTAPELTQDFEIVIHCAGKAHMVPRSEEEKEAFFNVNYHGTVHLCEGLERCAGKISTFVFISTVSVYGREEGTQIDENHPLAGGTPYALSKIQAEEHVRNWATKYNINYLIFRLPLLVGQNPPGNLGKMIEGILRRRFVHVKNGEARKSMLNADDLAPLILNSKGKSGIFNLTDGEHPSFKEIEEVIVVKSNSKPVRHLPYFFAKGLAIFGDVVPKFPFNNSTLKKMVLDLTFNDQKARKELGWKPTKVIDKLNKMNY